MRIASSASRSGRPAILSSLVMARALHGYQGRLLAKVAKQEETLRSRREIERATRILMAAKGLSEDRAYQLIRQQATAQRLTVGVLARSIITAHRVFEDSPEVGPPGERCRSQRAAAAGAQIALTGSRNP